MLDPKKACKVCVGLMVCCVACQCAWKMSMPDTNYTDENGAMANAVLALASGTTSITANNVQISTSQNLYLYHNNPHLFYFDKYQITRFGNAITYIIS